MYVCMCMCIIVCVTVCIRLRVCVHAWECMYSCACVCVYVCTYIRLQMCMYMYCLQCTLWMHAQLRANIHALPKHLNASSFELTFPFAITCEHTRVFLCKCVVALTNEGITIDFVRLLQYAARMVQEQMTARSVHRCATTIRCTAASKT